jgi:hypothetical protein
MNDNDKSTARRAGDAGSRPARPSPEGVKENTNASVFVRSKIVLGAALCAASVALILSAPAGCVSEADLSAGQAYCPTRTVDAGFDSFRPVSQVLERRCGTLDCHGIAARPLRIYGQSGLRKPESPESDVVKTGEYYTGGLVATTDAEVEANYLAACGLEPEIMDKVIAAQLDVTDLTLIRKPRLEEKHKGGRIWASGSILGDLCIVSWIQGEVNTEACRLELEKP